VNVEPTLSNLPPLSKAESPDWKLIRLGEYISIKHGYAFPGDGISDKPVGNILVTPGNFAVGGGFKAEKFKYFAGDVPADYILAEGDLVVTMTDLSKQADTLGYSAYIPAPRDRLFLHNQRIGKVEIKNPLELDKLFLSYLLRSKDYRDEVLASATGTTVKDTSPGRISAFKTRIPSLRIQEKIAHILGTLDDKIELNRQMSATLEEMARVRFKSWFIDFDPVRAKAEGRPTNLPPETDALFPDSFEDSELGTIPKGWRIGSIAEVATVGGGSTPSTKNPNFWDGECAWATPKDLSRLSHPVLLETERSITEAGLKSISSGVYPPGTVLMSSRAPIGNLAISEIPVAVNQGFMALQPSIEGGNRFLLRWIEFNMDVIHGRANGSTFMEISKSAFRSIHTVLPSDKVIEAFGKLIDPLHRRLVEATKESVSLATIRESLLPKLLSGELSPQFTEVTCNG
jgi:type I restriction enzyme, S subunit